MHVALRPPLTSAVVHERAIVFRDLLQRLWCLFERKLRQLRCLAQAHPAEERAPHPLPLALRQFLQRITAQRPCALHIHLP
jgi:hypothetical protein